MLNRLSRLGIDVEIHDDEIDPRPLPLVWRLAAAAFVVLALFALAGLTLEVWR